MQDAATLSRRESQVAEMIAWGASKKDVSNLLYITVQTVENHTRTIFKKTGCTKSNELSAWWFCTKYKIPFTDSPLFKKIATILVMVTATSKLAKLLMFFSLIIKNVII
jgi:DNA-binding CsgD family transcriptional regulator